MKILNANRMRIGAAIIETARHMAPLWLKMHPDQFALYVQGQSCLTQEIGFTQEIGTTDGHVATIGPLPTICGMSVVRDRSVPVSEVHVMGNDGTVLVLISHLEAPPEESKAAE